MKGMGLRLKILIKIVVFFLIFVVIGCALTYVFTPKWTIGKDRVTSTVVDFYQEADNTLDVLFLGTSNAAHGFSPVIIWENEGIASYSLSTQRQPPILSYYFLKEALKYQNPKVVVVDVSGFYKSVNYDNDRIKRSMQKALDFFPVSSLKLKMVSEIVRGAEKTSHLTYLCPLFNYHDRWQELKGQDFKSVVNEYSLKGADICYDIMPFEFADDYMTAAKADQGEMNEAGRDYLARIVELCRENNIQPVITSLTKVSWTIQNSEALQKFCKEYDVPFIDYNLKENREAIKLDSRTDYYDEGLHLNVLGAEKVSLNLGAYLKENYSLPDHRGEAVYAEWEDDLADFNREFLAFKQSLKAQ